MIGDDHLLEDCCAVGAAAESFRYHKHLGTTRDGLPYSIEAAFAYCPDGPDHRRLITGVNSPPELPEAAPDGEAKSALFNSETDFVTAIRQLIRHKKLIGSDARARPIASKLQRSEARNRGWHWSGYRPRRSLFAK